MSSVWRECSQPRVPAPACAASRDDLPVTAASMDAAACRSEAAREMLRKASAEGILSSGGDPAPTGCE